jgi:hypothetical protein
MILKGSHRCMSIKLNATTLMRSLKLKHVQTTCFDLLIWYANLTRVKLTNLSLIYIVI